MRAGAKMTAEIAVMNKWAVALAADSKVTISGMNASKAYDTANKVFTLSKFHPVGVMIFGNAEFMGYPWETIIKLYRKQKGRASESHVARWADDFLAFLRKFGRIDAHHKSMNLKGICGSWFGQALAMAQERASERSIAPGTEAYTKEVLTAVNHLIQHCHSAGEWASAKQRKVIAEAHVQDIVDVIGDYFSDFRDEALGARAVELAGSALFTNRMSPQSSGFVVAGFGDDEYFPTVVQYNIDGYVGNRIKVVQEITSDVSRSMQSTVRAFAQKEMVQTFMEGIDPGLYQQMLHSFSGIMEQNCLAVLDSYGMKKHKTNAVKEKISSSLELAVQGMAKGIQSIKSDKYINPAIRMVGLLPKDELAHLAESLVALTSLKRRVSSDAETVGGPIDVALISKGDGFVWIKRKHYFPRELNVAFFGNYMADIHNGANANEDTGTAIGTGRSAKPVAASRSRGRKANGGAGGQRPRRSR